MGDGGGDAGWGAPPPLLRISFLSTITMASGVRLKEAEQLVVFYL